MVACFQSPRLAERHLIFAYITKPGYVTYVVLPLASQSPVNKAIGPKLFACRWMSFAGFRFRLGGMRDREMRVTGIGTLGTELIMLQTHSAAKQSTEPGSSTSPVALQTIPGVYLPLRPRHTDGKKTETPLEVDDLCSK